MTYRNSGFLGSGHLPTLLAALLYFDVSFMTWVLPGPLAPFLRQVWLSLLYSLTFGGFVGAGELSHRVLPRAVRRTKSGE